MFSQRMFWATWVCVVTETTWAVGPGDGHSAPWILTWWPGLLTQASCKPIPPFLGGKHLLPILSRPAGSQDPPSSFVPAPPAIFRKLNQVGDKWLLSVSW